MLRFREFRKNILEAATSGEPGEMDGGTEPTAPEPSSPSPPAPPESTPQPLKPAIDTKAIAGQIKKDIDNLVVQWTNDLKKQLYSGEAQVKPRSLWDRFKGGLSNLWYGRQNAQNPYYWRNRLGDELGVRQESRQFNTLPFTLEEYKELREFFDTFEMQLKEEYEETPQTANLRINQIINAKANELRQKLDNLLNQHVQSGALAQIANAAQTSSPETPTIPQRTPRPKPQREVVLPGSISNYAQPTGEMNTAATTLATIIDDTITDNSTALRAISDFNSNDAGKLWNDFGGGLVVTTAACPDLPKIIRFGHPLIKYLEKFNQTLLTQLKRQKRIELKQGDIKTEEDLKQRISKATGIHGRTSI